MFTRGGTGGGKLCPLTHSHFNVSLASAHPQPRSGFGEMRDVFRACDANTNDGDSDLLHNYVFSNDRVVRIMHQLSRNPKAHAFASSCHASSSPAFTIFMVDHISYISCLPPLCLSVSQSPSIFMSFYMSLSLSLI